MTKAHPHDHAAHILPQVTPYEGDPIKKLPVRFLKADRVRVKSLPETRIRKGWGIRCRDGDRVWAGDIGRVETRLLEGNGWDQLQLVAVFPNHYVLSLGELVRPDDEGPTADLRHGVWRVCISTGDDVEKLAVVKADCND